MELSLQQEFAVCNMEILAPPAKIPLRIED